MSHTAQHIVLGRLEVVGEDRGGPTAHFPSSPVACHWNRYGPTWSLQYFPASPLRNDSAATVLSTLSHQLSSGGTTLKSIAFPIYWALGSLLQMPHIPQHESDWDAVGCRENPNVCAAEAACGEHNGSWICVCFHSGTPPVRGVCPRNTVDFPHLDSNSSSEYSHTNRRNSGILVQVVGSVSGSKVKEKVELEGGGVGGEAVLVGLLSLGLILLLGVVCWKRRAVAKLLSSQHQKSPGKGQPASPLPQDRFVLNPTYELSPLINIPLPVFLPQHIAITTQIGQGCFGKVFKGEMNGELVAVKVAKKEHGGEVLKEVETMAAFTHPNILRILGVVSNTDGEAPWLLFEFMDFGDLATLLRRLSPETLKCKEREQELQELSTEDLLSVAAQIAEGMSYLSSQHFVHRDLAARNCLVGRGWKVKVSDFGLSRDVYTCDYYKIGGSRLLPVRWMSPESVLYGRFTLESDVWAYGVLLWEIYTWAKQPFYGHSNEEVVQLILEGVLLSPPTLCPASIASLMAACWKTEPKDRLTFLQISATFKQTHKSLSDGEYERPTGKCEDGYMQVL